MRSRLMIHDNGVFVDSQRQWVRLNDQFEGRLIDRESMVHTPNFQITSLATLSFWSCGSRWVDPLLNKLVPKAILVIVTFAMGMCAMATVVMAFR